MRLIAKGLLVLPTFILAIPVALCIGVWRVAKEINNDLMEWVTKD